MADSKRKQTVALLELLVSSLAQIDALSELLIAKGFSNDRAKYQAMFRFKQ